MSIKDLFIKSKKPEDEKYVGSFKRVSASSIDLWIVLLLRWLTMILLSKFWLEQKLATFKVNFTEKFGTEVPKKTPEHINFILHSEAFFCIIIFVALVLLVGAVYHSYLNSSAWRGTIGKRLMKITIVTEDGNKISLLRAACHYFLSIVPFVCAIYLLGYKASHDISFYNAITASEINIFLAILLVGWMQIQVFTKKKTTAYDLICNTLLTNGRDSARFPWSKTK